MKKIKKSRQKRGRKAIFQNGLTYQQQLAAILLGLGARHSFILEEARIHRNTLTRWQKYDEFNKKVEWSRKTFSKKRKKLTKYNIDIEAELVDIVERSRNAPVKASDGIRALTILAKIQGLFAPRGSEKSEEYKRLEKLSDEELDEELKRLNDWSKKHEAYEENEAYEKRKEAEAREKEAETGEEEKR